MSGGRVRIRLGRVDVADLEVAARERADQHRLRADAELQRDRDGLRKKMTEQNIQSGIHNPTPLHLSKAYEHHNLPKGSFPIAEKLAEEIVSLPIYPEITEAQQARVVNVVKEHARSAR